MIDFEIKKEQKTWMEGQARKWQTMLVGRPGMRSLLEGKTGVGSTVDLAGPDLQTGVGLARWIKQVDQRADRTGFPN